MNDQATIDAFLSMLKFRYGEVGMTLSDAQINAWLNYFLDLARQQGYASAYQSALNAAAVARDLGSTNPNAMTLAMQARSQIRTAYRDFLFRDPDESEFPYWVDAVVNQGLSFSQLRSYIQNSDEAREALAAVEAARKAEIEAARLEAAQARIAAEIEAARRANAEAERIAQMQAQAQAAAEAEAARMKAIFEQVRQQEAAAAEAARMQTMPITNLRTEAELEAEALEIESYRGAIIETGATQADQDFLNQQALIAKQRADLDLATMQAQASLDIQSGAALQAYAVEVRADVADMYKQILKREADEGGLNYWTSEIVSGNVTGELVAVALSQSEEAIILGAYEQYLHRVPSMAERQYWIDAIVKQKLPIDQAVSYIANSEEAQQYHEVIVPTTNTQPLIVQTINPASGSAQAIDPIMGTSTWGASYTNQDMIAADPQASPNVELQNYYNPDVNISDLEAVSPLGDTSAALAFKARDEIYRAYTTNLKREPAEAEYQYWEPQLVNRALSLADFKRYVAESAEAKALATRTNAVTLATPETEQTQAKAVEGVGAAIGLLSALTFFLGQ